MLSSALISFPTEPSGPGWPFLAFWAARMLVSRSTSALIHSFMTSSRRAGDRSHSGSFFQPATTAPMGPLPRFGPPPPPPPMAVRSFISVVSDTRHPSPRSPMRLASGTRVSVM